jgi:hypothetical protein
MSVPAPANPSFQADVVMAYLCQNAKAKEPIQRLQATVNVGKYRRKVRVVIFLSETRLCRRLKYANSYSRRYAKPTRCSFIVITVNNETSTNSPSRS